MSECQRDIDVDFIIVYDPPCFYNTMWSESEMNIRESESQGQSQSECQIIRVIARESVRRSESEGQCQSVGESVLDYQSQN